MRYYLVLLLIIVVLTSFFAYASESNPGAEKAAIESAQTWLALVDGGKYSESWEEAAGYFQGENCIEKTQVSTVCHLTSGCTRRGVCRDSIQYNV
jgi:hypothetical protein